MMGYAQNEFLKKWKRRGGFSRNVSTFLQQSRCGGDDAEIGMAAAPVASLITPASFADGFHLNLGHGTWLSVILQAEGECLCR